MYGSPKMFAALVGTQSTEYLLFPFLGSRTISGEQQTPSQLPAAEDMLEPSPEPRPFLQHLFF